MKIRIFLTLALTSALEIVRRPITLLLIATCLVGTALLPFMPILTLGEESKLVRDSALSIHLVIGMLLGAYAAGTSLRKEISRATGEIILCKPVGRPLFFLSRFAAVVVVMALFSLAATLADIIASRAALGFFEVDWWAAAPLLAVVPASLLAGAVKNYFLRRPFVSDTVMLMFIGILIATVVASMIGPTQRLAPSIHNLPWNVFPAGMLAGLAVLVLSGTAVTLATRLDTAPITVLLSLLLIVGLISDYAFGRFAEQNLAAAALYAVIPNWQLFWTADALSHRGSIPLSYSATVAAYALFYLAGVLLVGILLFRGKEISSR